MFGLFRRRPKLAIALTPTRAVARELKREVSVAGELVVRDLGRVLVAGGTRRIDLALPRAWAGTVRLPAGGELRQAVDWTIALAAPMRAPAAEIQLNTTAGGRRRPLALSPKFPLANE